MIVDGKKEISSFVFLFYDETTRLKQI